MDAIETRARARRAGWWTRVALGATSLVLVLGGEAHAQEEAEEPPSVVFGGYVEAFYQWNFNDPSNGITNFRGFDNRHDTFTLSNVALDAQVDHENVVGRLTLQVGHTPSTYYLGEPSVPGSGGANASNAELFKYIQQAYAGYRFDVGTGLLVTAGLFLSPIGPEGVPVRDNWNFSRSDLFFGLPFYHTGVRATYGVSDALSLSLAVYNGWNSVVDNNGEKSLALTASLTPSADVALNVVYFTGVERSEGAPEGRAWRHDLDANLTLAVSDALSLMFHANAGFDPTNFGVSAWAAGAVYGRYALVPDVLFAAVRGDVFYEHRAANDGGEAAAIFWPVRWVSSGTATIDYRPHAQVSFRLEYRHDQAADDLFFGGDVAGDGAATPYVPNRQSQDTLTLGAITWF